MPTVKITQQLSTHQQMALLGQYSERGIQVRLSNMQGESWELGRVTRLVPMKDSFTADITYSPGVKRLNRNQLDGFVFSNFYGVYFLSKPLG